MGSESGPPPQGLWALLTVACEGEEARLLGLRAALGPPLRPAVRSVCDRQQLLHRAISKIAADWQPSYCSKEGATYGPLVQGFPSTRLGLTERGTQDSSLESPVLETGAFGTR